MRANSWSAAADLSDRFGSDSGVEQPLPQNVPVQSVLGYSAMPGAPTPPGLAPLPMPTPKRTLHGTRRAAEDAGDPREERRLVRREIPTGALPSKGAGHDSAAVVDAHDKAAGIGEQTHPLLKQ
jgi:hypothetical protein